MFGSQGFVVLPARLLAPLELRPSAVTQHAIAAGIDEQGRFQDEGLLGAELDAMHGEDVGDILHLDLTYGGVQKQAEVFFSDRPLVEHQVPMTVHQAFDIRFPVADALFRVNLVGDAGLFNPGGMPRRILGK